MARIHGIALVTLVLGGTALWLLLALPPDGGAGPEDGGPKTPQGTKTQAEPEGPAIRVEVPGTGAAKPPDEVPAAKSTPGGTDVEKAPDLTLRVRKIPGNAPLPRFKWTLTAGEEKTSGTADEKGSDVGLRLPPGTACKIRIECDGCEPREITGITAAEPQVLEVFLPVSGPGVSITAHDERGQPVKNVRVDAWRLAADAALDQTGATGEPLWSRRNGNDTGQYQIPTLEPGRYELRVMAVDAEGALLPLLPFRARFEITGSNSVPLQADLAPGALLTLQPVDPYGTPLRGTADDDRPPLPAIGLRVTGQDGKERDVDWRSTGPGRAVVERNRLVGAREVMAAEALPPGWLRITAMVDGAACGASEVMLLAGQHHKEPLVILLRR